MQKKNVEDRIGIISVYDFEGDVQAAIEMLSQWAETEGYQSIRLLAENVYHCYECPGESELVVMGTRPETDEELARRKKRSDTAKAAAKKKREKKKEQELKELERLKKKYESA